MGLSNVGFMTVPLQSFVWTKILSFRTLNTNIKIISHSNVNRQRCFVLSFILESQSFDLQVSKTTKLTFACYTFKRGVVSYKHSNLGCSLFWGTEKCPIIVLWYFSSLSSSNWKFYLISKHQIYFTLKC